MGLGGPPGERLAGPFHRRLVGAGLLPGELPAGAGVWMADLSDLLKNYVSHDAEVPEFAAPIFYAGQGPASDDAREAMAGDSGRAVMAAVAEAAEQIPPSDPESWQTFKRKLRERTGEKGKALFQPLRIAITGRTSGPELDRLVILVEQGHRLFPESILGVAERARRTLAWLAGR